MHSASEGFPILGDLVYGASEAGGLHLLARAIDLPLEPRARAQAAVPGHMRAVLGRCGYVD